MTRAQPTTKTSPKDSVRSPQLTLIDHLHELRTRLFWIILTLIIAGSASYLIKDQIMAVIMQPLGGQRLVYLTPIGGFNFIFKVSLYFGLAVILPVIIYHLYRFLEPLMDKRRKRSVFFFIFASFLLAIGGGTFAYFAGLPAALHFLTGFTIQNVSAMLTVESYLAFVVTYVLGFAALFQIPLILMIINTIRPIPPKTLMGFQRFVILGAFIVAAIISPTPDVTNQAILAVPIIVMYQVGVLLVWMQSRSANKRQKKIAAAVTNEPINRTQPAKVYAQPTQSTQPAPVAAPVVQPIQRQRPVMDIAGPRRVARPVQPIRTRPVQSDIIRRAPMAQPVRRSQPRPMNQRATSIDGIVSRTQPQAS
jgi:sec-independent protein translocase protein TatC